MRVQKRTATAATRLNRIAVDLMYAGKCEQCDDDPRDIVAVGFDRYDALACTTHATVAGPLPELDDADARWIDENVVKMAASAASIRVNSTGVARAFEAACTMRGWPSRSSDGYWGGCVQCGRGRYCEDRCDGDTTMCCDCIECECTAS